MRGWERSCPPRTRIRQAAPHGSLTRRARSVAASLPPHFLHANHQPLFENHLRQELPAERPRRSPRHCTAVSWTRPSILPAREILLLASGTQKATIVAKALEGPISAQVSASALQMHRHVTVIVDAEAGSELKRADYYRWVFQEKKRLIPRMIGKVT